MTAKRGSKATTRRNGDGARSRPMFVPPHGVHQRTDDANAFMPDPESGPARIRDDLAENLAEDYLQAATQGMEVEEDHDQIVPEEIGGPFVETSAADEFAHDVFLLDNLCVMLGVCGRGDSVDEFGQIRHAAHGFELVFVFEAG